MDHVESSQRRYAPCRRTPPTPVELSPRLLARGQEAYNEFGQLTAQYQEHSGPVNTASSPKVGYAYSTGGNFSRLSSVTYPNGRVLNYLYNSGIDTNISRVSALSDASGTGAGNIESYTYLGLDTIVQRLDGASTAIRVKQRGLAV